MPLENLVCDRELAERLKSSGYSQESVFWWNKHRTTDEWEVCNSNMDCSWDHLEETSCFAAPTAGELGEKLDIAEWTTRPCQAGFEIHIPYQEGNRVWDDASRYTVDKNLANAMAKMWIYLKENNLCQE